MKRKAEQEPETIPTTFPIDDLNQDLLEKILSWLPPTSFFRLRSVSKRWTSIAASPSFHLSCSQVPRAPYFLMVGHHPHTSVIFDSSEQNWKNLNNPQPDSLPVAASGGLVCYRAATGGLTVCNPLTAARRHLPPPILTTPLRAIAMSSSHKAYRAILVTGDISDSLHLHVFSSTKAAWEDEVLLLPQTGQNSHPNEPMYFLNKAGAVVAANTQRSPSKQFSAVIATENGEEVVYFLSEAGTVVGCNVDRRTVFEYPRLLPVFFEYSIDVVECGGEMLVVVLSEIFETASLRVWRFDKGWRQVAAMPPAMSHGFYGKRADINCVGCEGSIFVCVSSGEVSSYVMCDVGNNRWEELSRCSVGGEGMEFVSAFSFEPRLEASV